MVAVAYPTTLPGPLPGSFEPRPRRGASTIDGPLQQRARQRDAAGMTSQYTYVYTPHQMAIWREWYRTTLLDGRRWFAHALPGRGGMVPRVVKYRQVQQQLLGMGIYRVSASFEQRGASLMPDQPDLDPFAADVVLLLRNQDAAFPDESWVANPTQITGTPALVDGGGPWGLGAIDTSAGGLSFLQNAAYSFPQPGELCLEAWLRWGGGHTEMAFYYPAEDAPDVFLASDTSSDSIYQNGIGGSTFGPLYAGTWQHVVMQWGVTEDSVHRGEIYLDGLLKGSESSLTNDRSVRDETAISIGLPMISHGSWQGQIGEVRITKAKRYTRYFDGAHWRIHVPTGPMLPAA